jgi:ABC-type lipoprotein export system ATPase subunit
MMFTFGKRNGKIGKAQNNYHLIDMRQVEKVYKTTAGGYQALKGINLTIERGEFVGIIGKSGSGKSTLINMITGIDRPTTGEVWVGGTPIHQLSEDQMAGWRGKNLGIVFQFFQLLPTLSVIENVMLPMDFCNAYPARERKTRAMQLLDLVDMSEHAYKLPSALSGGQQQRVAIARSLANDPPLIIADEPTGNLDSKTADAMFRLFERLASEGKTVVMVTHDSSLARRVSRTVIIADGEVIAAQEVPNEYVARALPALTPQMMLQASRKAAPVSFQPGATVIHEGQPGENFYIITRGCAEVLLKRPGGSDVVAGCMEAGQSFGEISLFNRSRTVASVRAIPDAPLEVLALDGQTFHSLLDESPEFRGAVQGVVSTRLANNQAIAAGIN